MAALTASKGVALRPHAKTHKSVDIAKRQIAAGAAGVCCAKIGEAEVLADGGVTGILITSPVAARSEEHTSELQSLMRSSYAVFCLKTQKQNGTTLMT